MNNNMDFDFSSNANKGDSKRQNRFIFSDDYYDSLDSSEVQDDGVKAVDAPVQRFIPSLMDIASSGEKKDIKDVNSPSSVQPTIYDASNFVSHNPNVSQASSFDQLVQNNYDQVDNVENVFDFFGHNAHTNLKNEEKPEEDNPILDTVAIAQDDQNKKSFLENLEDKLSKKRKDPGLDVVHVGDIAPVHLEPEEKEMESFDANVVTEPVSTPEFNSAVPGLKEEYNLNNSASFVDNVPSQAPVMSTPEDTNPSTFSSADTSVKEDNHSTDFLLKKEEIPSVEKNIQYDKKNTNILDFSSFHNVNTPNQFIVNQEPNVRVEANEQSFQQLAVPDFMSGTVKTEDLNIATGVNEELEKELIAQKQLEEEEKKKLQASIEGYDLFKKDEPETELIYKAGGKSIIREKQKKPKSVFTPQPVVVTPPPAAEEEDSSEETNVVNIDQQLQQEQESTPQVYSIQDMIEQIVGVPDLDSVLVPIDKKANPGVIFGNEPLKEKKEEEKPVEATNVYHEDRDNFDYDQNFDHVKVTISDLLPKLKEKANQEGKISILARYGEDFCAREYITNPAIGRAEEIKQLILILLTPEKSGILVGKPGIGKTSIVEGLAYQLQRDNVPDALKGYCIVSVKTPSLLGTLPTGETRLQTLVDELKGLEKIILFIDEIHMLIGSTNESAMDFANMFKESLGRGSIKVIGATTTEEYERYILRDKAFVRRFQKVDVEEPNRELTIKILMGTLPKIEKTTGAKLKYTQFIQSEIMGFIVDITSEYKRIYGIGSRYPDICLTLLAQAFSQAVFANRKEVTILDVRKAIENSKNIYPDVIKKELVHFDQKFKDIIREEETSPKV